VTLASATCFISAPSSSTYSDNEDIGACEDKHDITFSNALFGQNGRNFNMNDNMNSNEGDQWMGDIPDLDGLCASLPVPGSHAELRLGISVLYNKLPYTASFSVLSGLTKSPSQEHNQDHPQVYPEGAHELEIPTLDLLMSNQINNSSSNDRKGFSKSETPRLKLCTSYVPFVIGRLTVCCQSVRFISSVQQSSRFPDGRPHRCALRFSMSAASFGYSDTFEIPSSSDTVITVPIKAPISPTFPLVTTNSSGYNQQNQFKLPKTKIAVISVSPSLLSRNPPIQNKSPLKPHQTQGIADPESKGFFVTLPVDTMEMMSQPSSRMLTMRISLVDVDESGAQYVLGDGALQTAPLYYQALRSASSSPPATVPRSSKNPIGMSPNMTTEVVIYNRLTNKPIAWVMISTQFFMESLSSFASVALKAARSTTHSSLTSKYFSLFFSIFLYFSLL
jgi:hypothetical protein